MKKLILIGAGGYAKSVLDSVDYYNYQIEGFIDDFTNKKEHLGYPIISNSLEKIENKQKYYYFISIGNNERRKIWFDRLIKNGLKTMNIIDKSAIISPRATIGTGNFFGKMSIVNGWAFIGNNCIINTKALIEHGCKINDNCNISTNTVLNGDVIVGESSFIGSSSVTIGQLKIGKHSTVGAGAVVIHDVEDNVTVAGVPAKLISNGAMLG